MRQGRLHLRGPRQYQRNAPKPASTKAVGFCPAVLDYEARIFEVPCPFDLHLRLARDAEGNLQLQYPRPNESTSNPQYVSRLIVASNPSEWREPSKPVLQITTLRARLAPVERRQATDRTG